MTDTQRVDVERLSELLSRATPGPWRWSGNGNIMAPGSRDVDEICAVYTDDEESGAPNAPLIVEAINALPALLQQLADAMNAVNGLTEELESAEAKLAERDAEIGDWQNLLTAVIAPRSLPGLSVEYPKLWPFDGGQDAAMVAFALHTAIERAESAERAREGDRAELAKFERECRIYQGQHERAYADHQMDGRESYHPGRALANTFKWMGDRIAAFLAANGGCNGQV